MEALTIQNAESVLSAIQQMRQESTTICKHLEKIIVTGSASTELKAYILANRKTILTWRDQIRLIDSWIYNNL